MQAVVIARFVTQQQRRRSGLLMPVTNIQEFRQRWRKPFRLIHPFHPAIDYSGERRIETLAQFGDERRQRRGKVLILSAPEIMPLHHHPAAERSAVRVKAYQFIAFGGREQRGAERVALFIQLRGESWPVAGRDSMFRTFHCYCDYGFANFAPLRLCERQGSSSSKPCEFREIVSRKGAKARSISSGRVDIGLLLYCFAARLGEADFSFSSNRRLRSTPQR